ncbi:MAG: hypothetical protein VKL59_06435 [Nostocaceae cyanobacterium]|nr:hypothetical protein [Nostocaceae cyanobacterium]
MDLFKAKIYALRVLNYYSQVQAEQVSQNLIKDVNLERYRRAPDVGVRRSGITFFETNGSIDMLERYYKEAPEFIQNLRKNCFPFLSPIDKLRLDLGDMQSVLLWEVREYRCPCLWDIAVLINL